MKTSKLLVVIDPMTDDQLALQRALDLAVATQADLHLFCCTYLTEEEQAEFCSKKEAKLSQLSNTKTWLEELAEPARRQGLNVDTEVIWNQNWESMVANAAGRAGATLVIKTSFKHSRLSRALSRTSDIHLMRTSPCPVLLVKSDDAYQNGIILAAVCLDANQPHHEPLNNVIVSQARQLATATGSELHLVSAESSPPEILKLFHWMEEPHMAPKDLVARRFGVPALHIHLAEGAPKTVIPDVAQKLHADLLVMGTASRTGLAATVLGNTAEKVIDLLDIDLLSVSK